VKKKFLKTVMLISSGIFIVDAAFGIAPVDYRIQTASTSIHDALKVQFGLRVTRVQLKSVAHVLTEVANCMVSY
jgi:hypothetical protein